jgi:DNA repair exonuclease SbcCD ATPase subunit
MLADADLVGLDSQLDVFTRDSKQHHETHLKLLHQFQELIENYRQLKSDYEEEKESREKYKKLARGQVRPAKLPTR